MTPSTEIGAYVARGFSPGGFSFAFPSGDAFNDGVTPASLPEFDEETRTLYEFFVRTRTPDDRLQLSANVFYNDISNPRLVSRSVLPNGDDASFIINGDEAESYGLEVAAEFQANERLKLFGSLGLLRSKLTKFSASPDVEGNELREAPEYTLNMGFSWDVTPKFTVGGDVSWIDGYYSDFTNDPDNEVPDRTLVNLNASYALSDEFELYGYVDNVFDESEAQFLFRSGERGVITKPREIGFGLRATF